MPSYDLVLLAKVLTKNELSTVLKRAANYIFDQGGFLRKINNMGEQATPYKISSHGSIHKKANYFIIEFDTSTKAIDSLIDSLKRDVDLVRTSIFLHSSNEDTTECKLSDEIQPPMYRKEVLDMIETAKRKEAQHLRRWSVYKHNTGLNYYPFQR